MDTRQVIATLNNIAINGWLRLLARYIDIIILAIVVGFISGVIHPHALKISGVFSTILLLFIWTFIEAVLLCTWGITPGKWLLGIKIQTIDRNKLNFAQALKRSINVWLKGLGIGLPLISIVTLMFSYYQLIHNKITSWDRDGDFLIVYHKIDMIKITFVILIYTAFVVLMYWQ